MNDEFKVVMALIVVSIVIGAIIDFLKLSKQSKSADSGTAINLASLPPGSIIVLPKGSE